MLPAAYAVINLDAAKHNFTRVRETAPSAKVMAVIKANGYGHDMERMAFALCDAQAFAVARTDEGVRLRLAGLTNPIAVLEGFTSAEELEMLLANQLDAVVHCSTQIEILSQHKGAEKLGVWVKLDTGMNRLGFKPHEFNAVIDQLKHCPNIKQPVNLMTHLANSDDKSDTLTLRQISIFHDTVGDHPGQRSIANSAGILGWKEAHSDWVRPGIMLYGISPFPELTGVQLGLQPVMSLHSKLIAVKPIAEGERVGYAGTWLCEKPTLLGVVAIGYGDGYPRHAKSGTPVLVKGRRVPLIGRVSMDMITVDLGAVPDAVPGDAVTLWGEELAVEEIAHFAGTIPYTLVCGVTQRVQKIEVPGL